MKVQGSFLVITCLVLFCTDTAHTQNIPPPPVAPQAVQPPPVAPQAVQTPPAAPQGTQQPPPPGPCPYTADFTAADCALQSCYAGPPNGCGSRSLLIIKDDIVPDKWPAGVNFNEACNVHDTCYFTPGVDKNTCDNNFHEALLAECRRALQCTNLTIVGQQCFGDPTSNPLFKPCQELADLYFNAVQKVGQGPFTQDQQQAQQYADQCRQAKAQRGAG